MLRGGRGTRRLTVFLGLGGRESWDAQGFFLTQCSMNWPAINPTPAPSTAPPVPNTNVARPKPVHGSSPPELHMLWKNRRTAPAAATPTTAPYFAPVHPIGSLAHSVSRLENGTMRGPDGCSIRSPPEVTSKSRPSIQPAGAI